MKTINFIEATIEHGKYSFPASENAKNYIDQTLKSSVLEKFDECHSIQLEHFEGLTEVIFLVEDCGERMSVIKNRIAKQMRNMSKRYNKRCYVKN